MSIYGTHLDLSERISHFREIRMTGTVYGFILIFATPSGINRKIAMLQIRKLTKAIELVVDGGGRW